MTSSSEFVECLLAIAGDAEIGRRENESRPFNPWHMEQVLFPQEIANNRIKEWK